MGLARVEKEGKRIIFIDRELAIPIIIKLR
jgi:hypothetical protein